MSDRPFADATERFLAVERTFDLLDEPFGEDVYAWERVRFDAHQSLLCELGLIGEPHAGPGQSTRERLAAIVRSLAVENPFRLGSRDVLVWGHERRKQRPDGLWWDVYCDPVLAGTDWEYAYLESPHEGEHLRPARTDHVGRTDLIDNAPGIYERLRDPEALLSPADRELLDTVDERFVDEFGIGLEVRGRVARALAVRRGKLPLLRRLLDRVDPTLALVVTSYTKHAFIEACQERGVPVAELQHGNVSPYHLGYHYPDGGARTVPDYLLTFGEAWSEFAALPQPPDRVLPVGYPYLEAEHERVVTSATPDNPVVPGESVVVVSQGTAGPRLAEAAVELAETVERPVVYKLHPGEYNRWRDAYPELADAAEADALCIVGGEPALYELFAAADAQVGVYSTALYEGLAFGLDTYLLAAPGVEYMDRLVEAGVAVRREDAAGLATAIEEARTGGAFDHERFFRPDALTHVRRAVERLRANPYR